MSQPLISVIVPVYNVENYISDCVTSLVAQTYPNTEIILVDDGSADGSPALCDRFAREHGCVRVIHQGNTGPSGARNAGIDAAKGEYLLFVDSDDTVSPELISVLYGLLCEYNADIACASHRESGQRDVSVLGSEQGIMQLLKEDTGLTTSSWGKLYSRALFDGVRFPENIIFEDYYTTPLLFDRARVIVYTDRFLYNYRSDNSQSIMHSRFSKRRLAFYDVSDCVERFLAERYPRLVRLSRLRRTRYSVSFYKQAVCCVTRDRETEALLVSNVRRGIIPYLFGSGKLSSKAYGVVISICPPLAAAFFKKERKNGSKE